MACACRQRQGGKPPRTAPALPRDRTACPPPPMLRGPQPPYPRPCSPCLRRRATTPRGSWRRSRRPGRQSPAREARARAVLGEWPGVGGGPARAVEVACMPGSGPRVATQHPCLSPRATLILRLHLHRDVMPKPLHDQLCGLQCAGEGGRKHQRGLGLLAQALPECVPGRRGDESEQSLDIPEAGRRSQALVVQNDERPRRGLITLDTPARPSGPQRGLTRLRAPAACPDRTGPIPPMCPPPERGIPTEDDGQNRWTDYVGRPSLHSTPNILESPPRDVPKCSRSSPPDWPGCYRAARDSRYYEAPCRFVVYYWVVCGEGLPFMWSRVLMRPAADQDSRLTGAKDQCHPVSTP